MARILMVVRPSKGGAFGHVVRLGAELARRGHDVGIVGPHEERRGELEARGLEVLPVAMERAPSIRGDLRASSRVAVQAEAFRPDVIHAHGSKGGVYGRLARIRSLRSVSLVHSPHNYGWANYFASGLHRAFYFAIELALAPLVSRVACVCENERRLASRLGLGRRARTVYNGIEPLPPPSPRAEVDHLALCAIAELSPPKGVITLVEAMPQILREVPGVRLTVGGEGSERAAIEARVAELGVEGAVSLPGSIADVATLLSESAVVVQPGWAESFPYAILEAMSLARPIVATDVGGVGEAIEDGITGRLVAARDPEALAGAIVDLLRDQVEAERLGAAAQARMLERFTLEQMVRGTLDVYAELGVS